MFDVFTEQIEVLIKDGIANLYWFRGDLQKAWTRAGVPDEQRMRIAAEKDGDGRGLTKRKQMDRLYQELRSVDFNKRLEISRNFVRFLVEHKNFAPQSPNHHIEVAERAALKLRELINEQDSTRERKERLRRESATARKKTYEEELAVVREAFDQAQKLAPQARGYALERLFGELMRVSGVTVEEPFRIAGEQLDGAIKYDGHYYLIELKWVSEKLQPAEVGSFYFKVEGKLGARGIIIAMNAYTDGVHESVLRGKELRVILLDGNHLANVVYGIYTFQELLDHAVKSAALRGRVYCTHAIS